MFTHFNNSQFERYLMAFGKLFSRVYLVRTDASHQEQQRFIVPIEHAAKERWYTRNEQDPNLTQGVQQITPRMSFELSAFIYDGGRHLQSMNQVAFPTTSRGRSKLYVPAPYNLTITLSILVKNQQDGFQIVEQILPFFTPDLTMRVFPIAGYPLQDQVSLTLLNANCTDNYAGSLEPRRNIIWELNFLMKVNFWGGRQLQSPIEEVLIDFYTTAGDISEPPRFVYTEDYGLILTEDDSGRLMNEETSDAYLNTGRIARIESKLTPPDQEPGPDVHITTTFTEWDGDVKRSFNMTDEDV